MECSVDGKYGAENVSCGSYLLQISTQPYSGVYGSVRLIDKAVSEKEILVNHPRMMKEMDPSVNSKV